MSKLLCVIRKRSLHLSLNLEYESGKHDRNHELQLRFLLRIKQDQ